MGASPLELCRVVVTWKASRCSDAQWAALAEKLKPVQESIESPAKEPLEDYLVSGPILGEGNQIAAASVMRRKAMDWSLQVLPRPTTPAPEGVESMTARIGGFEGLRALILESQDGSTPVSANYRLAVSLPEDRWRCLAIPKAPAPEDPSLLLDPEAKVEQIGYRMTGPNGLLEVSMIYDHERREYELVLRAKGLLALKEGLTIPYAADILRIGIDTFFRGRHADKG